MSNQISTLRVAVVSGGSSGIGRALVTALHAEGYRILTCGRDVTNLRQLEKDLPGVKGFVCDVADRKAVQAFADQVLAKHPAIDLLISNAGGLKEIDFTSDDLRGTDLTSELRINTEGAIHLIAAFMLGLRHAARASILIVSSGYALAPTTRAPIYSAAKAALHSLSKSLRRQLAPLHISVTELLPPLVDTPAVAHRTGKKMSPQDIAHTALDGVRRGQAEVRPGDIRFLPMMLRVLPSVAERIVGNT